MSNKLTIFEKIQLTNSLRLVLRNYRSVKSLYEEIQPLFREKSIFSYSQFNRYLKGDKFIPEDKEEIIMRFLHRELELFKLVIEPTLELDLETIPIKIDLTHLMAYPEKLSLIAFHVITQKKLKGKFNAILTHSEAVPLAISFSQLLNIPWFSITFRQPLGDPSGFYQYPYMVDKELVRVAYFLKDYISLKNYKILIVSDYIRRGGFIDILFKVAEDNYAEIKFLFAVIALGTLWKRFSTELEENIHVIHYV